MRYDPACPDPGGHTHMPATTSITATPARPDTALVAARDDAVCCDLAKLSMLAIAGADAATFLNGQLSVDVRQLKFGACRYASYNSPKGRMLANFVLWQADREGGDYRLLLPAEIAEAVRRRLATFVLRSKVTLVDVSADHLRMGVGGPNATDALRAALGIAPGPLEVARVGETTVLGLAGPRFVVVVPMSHGHVLKAALGRRMVEGEFAIWQWLTVRAGVPIVTVATQDALVAQTANWDLLGGIDFQKGCYTGQEVIARMQYLGRLKERTFLFHVADTDIAAGTRLFNPVFDDQPCGTVVNAAPAPAGGSDLLAVVQLAAVEHGGTRLGAPGGPVLEPLPLPYPLPAPLAPRSRIG